MAGVVRRLSSMTFNNDVLRVRTIVSLCILCRPSWLMYMRNSQGPIVYVHALQRVEECFLGIGTVFLRLEVYSSRMTSQIIGYDL